MEKSHQAPGHNIHNKPHLQLVYNFAINKLMGLKIGIAIDMWNPNTLHLIPHISSSGSECVCPNYLT